MKHVLILALILVSCSAAQARLMELRMGCLERYGEPKSQSANRMLWIKEGIVITAEFQGDECAKISYRKIKAVGNDVYEAFSEAEIESLLAANANGRKWEKDSDWSTVLVSKNWKTSEGWYVCEYAHRSKILTFMTTSWRDREIAAAKEKEASDAAAKAAADKKKLEGF